MTVFAGAERLLERDGELADLVGLLARSQAGRGAVAVIGGPPGIGKTALLDALRGHAAGRGVRSLRACGRVLEAGMAFAVLRQLLEPAVLSAAQPDRRRLLAGPARFGVGALGLPGGAAPDSEFAAVHGLYWLLANLAERTPLLMTVDDVQWVDGPSLAWLGYLLPRAAELPALVVLTARDPDTRRAPAVDTLLTDPAVRRLALAALSPVSVGTLVRRDLGRGASAEFCAACVELTSGNPLYIRELLAAVRAEQLRLPMTASPHCGAWLPRRSARPCWPGSPLSARRRSGWPGRWQCSARSMRSRSPQSWRAWSRPTPS